MTAAALSDAVAEATAAAPSAFATDDTHNAYQHTRCALPASHVRNQQMLDGSRRRRDELDPSRAIRALYAATELLGLVKAITDGAHRLADPQGGLYQMSSRSGVSTPGTTTRSVTVTLSLVQAAEGGAFEFTERPGGRSTT